MKFEKRQKFAIRKFSVGVASVLIGQFFIGAVANAPIVHASEVIGSQSEKQNVPAFVESQPKSELATVDTDTTQVVPIPESDQLDEKPVATQPSIEASILNSEKAVSTEKDPKVQPETLPKEVAETIQKKSDRKPLVDASLTKLEEKKEVTNPDKDQLETTILEAEVVTKEAEKFLSSLTDSTQKTAIGEALRRYNQLLTETKNSVKLMEGSNTAFDPSYTNLSGAIEAVWNQLKKMGHSGEISYMLEAETTSQPAVLIPKGATTIYSYGATMAPNVEFDISTDLSSSRNTDYSRFSAVRNGLTLNEDARKLGLSIREKSFTNASGSSDTILGLSGNVPVTVKPGTYNVGFRYNNQDYTTSLIIKSVNELPYITVENESGYSTVTKDGSDITLSYKTGTSRIDPKTEVELTQGAKDLGLTYDSTNQRISGKITLDKTVKEGTYDIGLVSKDGFYRSSQSLIIRNPSTYEINTHPYLLKYFNPSAANGSDDGLVIPTTTFGYAIGYDSETVRSYNPNILYGSYSRGNNNLENKNSIRTIKDAKKDTLHYYTEFGLRFSDSSVPLDKVRIDKFERIDTNADVAYELVDVSKLEPDNAWKADSDYVDSLPYRVRFTKLPKQQANFTIKFKTTDSFGTEKIFTVPVRTEERSVANKPDNRLNDYLTHADVLLHADKLYQVKNPTPVAVPKSTALQKLGELVLNKENAELIDIKAPEGVSITRSAEDPTKYVITKKDGVILPIGVHKITAKAKDGHYGEDAPLREFTFEVMDGLNPISNQSWQEGQAIPTIPVSMTNGSKITSLSVESDGGHFYLSPNADNTGLTGYALKHTDAPQTAIVTATYTNNEGQSRQIKTSFTYTVTPLPVSDLTLSITNDKQTVSEGTKFADMVVTATEGATVTVGTLPDGVMYDSNSKTLSGTGLYEGHYVIPVTATKDGVSITKVVDLTVTPGNFTVPTANYTFTAGNEIPTITLKIPANATVSSVGGTLPRGLSWSSDRKTITGTPTQVGTFQVYGYVNRTTSGGTNQSTYGYVNITVNSVPLNFSIPDNTKTVKALDELPPINLQADGAVLSITSGSLPPGVNYDATTKTVSGTPTKVGTYTATFTATNPTISGNSTASATLTINVTSRDLTVTVDNKEQEKTVLTAIDNVVLTPSDNKARLEVDTSQLPPGVTYDSVSRTISGTPSKVGEYLIPYKATFPEMAESPVDGGHIKINVRPLPVSINVTEKEQMIRLGETIKNMVVSHSEHSSLVARYLSVDLPETDLDSYLESTAGLNYNPATHTISGTPTKPGIYKVRLKATLDSETLGKGIAEEIITVTVVDDPVTLDIKNDRQMIALGKNGLRPITFAVPAGATLTVDKTKLPDGVTYDESAKTISGTPTVAGAFDIPVTVTNAGKTKSITKDITIDVVDLTPSTPTITVKENNDGTHTITISQPGANPVETIIKNGKDGETPNVKVDRDETKKETTLTFYSDKNANNQFDVGTDTVLGTSVIKDGQDGVAGPKGDKGDQGLQGERGQDGAQGLPGQNGRDGKDILNGTNTPTAQDGKDGDTFINTTTGDVFVKKNGEWQLAANIKGPKGDKGDQGLQGERGQDGAQGLPGQNGRDGKDILNGTNTPTAQDGKDGDTFINTTTGDVFVKKNGEWQLVANIKGAKGDKGDQGLQGRDGQNGTNGRDGIDGKSPTIVTNENQDGTHTIVITNPDGTRQEIVVKNGKDGKDGNCTCVNKPVPPLEDKPQEPKGNIPKPPRKDEPQEPKGNIPKPPREVEPQEKKDDKPGKDTSVNVVAVPVPSETNTEVSDFNFSEHTSQRNTALPNTGSQTEVISVLLGSGILLTLYVAKRKED